MRKFFLLVTIAFTLPQASGAQAMNALQQGARIEVTPIRGKARTGNLMSLEKDSLFYSFGGSVKSDEPGNNHTASLALAEVKSVRVSRGRNHVIGLLTKGLLGTAVGVATGSLLGAATYNAADNRNSDGFCLVCTRGQNAALAGFIGGALGLVGGSVYGGITGNDRWENVDLRKR